MQPCCSQHPTNTSTLPPPLRASPPQAPRDPTGTGRKEGSAKDGEQTGPPTQGKALARPQPRSLPPPLRHKPGPAAGGPSRRRRLRLTCGVQEEPQRQAPAQGRVCRPHPQPGHPHGARRARKGERRRPGHGQRPEAEPGLERLGPAELTAPGPLPEVAQAL